MDEKDLQEIDYEQAKNDNHTLDEFTREASA